MILYLEAYRHCIVASANRYRSGLNILRKQDSGRNPPIVLKSFLNWLKFTSWAFLRYNLGAFFIDFLSGCRPVPSKDLRGCPWFANGWNTWLGKIWFRASSTLIMERNTLKGVNEVWLRDVVEVECVGQGIDFLPQHLEPLFLPFLLLLALLNQVL